MTNQTVNLRTELNEMALELASATVEYYSVKMHVDASVRDHGSALREDEFKLRAAYNYMLDVQNQMSSLAEQLAKAEY